MGVLLADRTQFLYQSRIESLVYAQETTLSGAAVNDTVAYERLSDYADDVEATVTIPEGGSIAAMASCHLTASTTAKARLAVWNEIGERQAFGMYLENVTVSTKPITALMVAVGLDAGTYHVGLEFASGTESDNASVEGPVSVIALVLGLTAAEDEEPT
jgi:hypothetical protein